MSSNTKHLGLLKKDPIIDKNETFNIQTMLNENWDKIDDAVEGGFLQSKAYIDEQINLVTATGIPKLVSYPLQVTATEDKQTKFEIPLDTFDVATDTLLVVINRAFLDASQYAVKNGTRDAVGEVVKRAEITLVKGVSVGSEISLLVLKNVPIGEDGSINGAVLAVDSVPVDRISGLKDKLDEAKIELSNAINGTREDVAATEQAVKTAYDRANEAFQAGNERKEALVAALVAKGITATINDSWATLVSKIGSMFGKGSVLSVDKVSPPVLPIPGNFGDFMPAYNSSYVYSITGPVYSKYDLNGKFLYSFGLSGLNDNEYRTRGGLWTTASDYFFYRTSDSYSGDIRFGYGIDSSGKRPNYSGSIFAQSDGQNSGGGYFGILGVSSYSDCYYYDKNGFIHRSNGASTAKLWTIANFSASSSLFHPSTTNKYIVCCGRVNGNARLVVLSASNGGMIAQLPWTHDGGQGSYPGSITHPNNTYDYTTDHLYVFPAMYNTAGFQGYIYKYELNSSTGALTLVKTMNLDDYFKNRLWGANTYGYYYYTGVMGILGNDIVIEAYPSNSRESAERKIVLLNKNLSTDPVYSEYLTHNVSSVAGVQVQSGSGMITRSGLILNKNLGYTIK